MRSAEHVGCVEQSGAQNVSPPNWPHFALAAHSLSAWQGVHAASAPPTPALDVVVDVLDAVVLDVVAPVVDVPLPEHAKKKSAAGVATSETVKSGRIAKWRIKTQPFLRAEGNPAEKTVPED